MLAPLVAWSIVAALVQDPGVPPPPPETRAASRPRVVPRAQLVDPRDVRLLAGPFRDARDLGARYLLAIESDRLLARFRREAGLAEKAKPYDGWEADTISGHSAGHYLSGLAKMWASTGDARLRERAAHVVHELAACQQTWGDGYVAAIPGGRRVFDEIRRGDIRSKGFDLNGLWVPWYVIHKEMAGLRDVYRLCGNEEARAVLVALADWAAGVVEHLDDATLSRMLRCEQGGMSEVAADVWEMTGDPRHRRLAQQFQDWVVLGPLAAGRDILPGLHANTQIPKILGAARQWELGFDDVRLRDAALFFWQRTTTVHAYATGGNSLNEYFGPPGQIASRLDGNTTETCNTYNQLRLTRLIHAWSADAAAMDYYERAVFNHILASQNPATGAVCYYLPLQAGSRKPFQRPFDDFTCCVGTGMENHGSYGDAIYSIGDHELFVNLFIASEFSWRARGVSVRQETRLPDDGAVTIAVATAMPAEFTLEVRRPAWAGAGFAVAVNGEPVVIDGAPGSYLPLHRTWKDGDRVSITLPLQLRVEAAPDDPETVVLFHGPVIMAGVLGTKPPEPAEIPCIVSPSADATAWFAREAGPAASYLSGGAVRPAPIRLVPFFRVRDEHYVVYWKHLTPEGWTQREADRLAAAEQRRALAARTVDFVQPGEMQPERDHAFDGERTNQGEHQGLRWRDAFRGGWFAFTMKVVDAQPLQLVCTYWGSDRGDRVFDILVDDVRLATETLENRAPGRFIDVTYALPPDLMRGKSTIRVKFQARPTTTAGGVFGIRIVKP